MSDRLTARMSAAVLLTLSLGAVPVHSARLADVVVVVATNGSMADEAAFVQAELNGFASTLSAAGLDLHLILISSTDICVGLPLGSGACPVDTNLPGYRHVIEGVGSSDALDMVLNTYCQWAPSLRHGASRSLLVVSDDDSSLGATAFTSGLLTLSQGFQGFGFHAIAASEDPDPFDPICSDTSMPGPPWLTSFSNAEGVVYKELANQTGGVFYDLCTQNFLPGFQSIAAAVDAATPDVAPAVVVINEIRVRQLGTDSDEYFELTGPPGTPLEGFTYVVLGDGPGGSGTVEEAVPLTGTVASSGFFVVAESGFTLLDPADPGQVHLVAPLNFENNDNVTHLLMTDFGAALGDDLDPTDDGIAELLCGAPHDIVAMIAEPNTPTGTEFHYGPPGQCDGSDRCATVGPVAGAGAQPAHVRRCPDGGGWLAGERSTMDPGFPNDAPGRPNQCPDAAQPLWSLRAGDGANQQAQSVTTDPAGNVILGGGFAGVLDFGGGALSSQGSFDVFVARLDPNGTHLVSARFGDGAFQVATAVAADELSNILLAGAFDGEVNFGGPGEELTSLGEDIFVTKLSPDGVHLWSRRFGDANPAQTATAVTADRSGNVILAGDFIGTVNFGGGNLVSTSPQFADIFLAKFDADGNHDVSASFGSTAIDRASDVAVDAAGNIFMTGSFQAPLDFGGGPLFAGDQDAFLVKFNPSLVHLWSMSFGGVGPQAGLGLAVDSSGSVVLAGSFEGDIDLGMGPHMSAGGSDVFLAKFDASGNPVWSRSFGDGNPDLPGGVAVGPAGSIALGGHFSGLIDFGGGPHASSGSTDVFLARFSGSGELLWSEHFGDLSSQLVTGVTMDGFADSLLVGALEGTMDFGQGALSSAGGTDVFVAKESDSALADLAVTKGDGVTAVVPGESLIYTITATNNGPADVGSATVTDNFPMGLTCAWTSIATGGASGNSAAAGNLQDSLIMPAGSSVTYSVTCDTAANLTGMLSNTATLNGELADPVSGNNSATDSDTELTPQADLSLSKADSAGPVIVGDVLTYTLSVTNLGPFDSSGGEITDPLPLGAVFQSSADGCTELGGTVSCSFTAIAVGNSIERRFDVSVLPAAVPELSNTATVVGAENDPDGTNDSATAQTRVFDTAEIFADGFESGSN